MVKFTCKQFPVYVDWTLFSSPRHTIVKMLFWVCVSVRACAFVSLSIHWVNKYLQFLCSGSCPTPTLQVVPSPFLPSISVALIPFAGVLSVSAVALLLGCWGFLVLGWLGFQGSLPPEQSWVSGKLWILPLWPLFLSLFFLNLFQWSLLLSINSWVA